MIIKNIEKFYFPVIMILIFAQLLNYSILPLLIHIPSSFILALKYGSLVLVLIFFIPSVKIEWRMLLVIIFFALSLIINIIASKFNAPMRFSSWVLLLMTIGPLFYNRRLLEFKEKLIQSLLFTFMLLGAFSFIYWLLGIPSIGRGHFSGLFAHSMTLAPVSALGALYAFHKYTTTTLTKIKITFIILFLFNIMSLFLSASRSALIGFVLGFIVYILFVQIRFKKLIIFFSLFLIFLAYNFSDLHITNTSVTSKMFERGLANTREILWHDRLLEFNANPFFGVGFAAQDDNIKGKIGKKGSAEGKVEPGSTYLMVLSMTGLFGAFALIYFFSRMILSKWFWREILNKSLYKFSILLFFSVHFIAEAYIFSAGSFLAFFFWLLIATIYPYKNRSKL